MTAIRENPWRGAKYCSLLPTTSFWFLCWRLTDASIDCLHEVDDILRTPLVMSDDLATRQPVDQRYESAGVRRRVPITRYRRGARPPVR
jgi:hypothetical protein